MILLVCGAVVMPRGVDDPVRAAAKAAALKAKQDAEDKLIADMEEYWADRYINFDIMLTGLKKHKEVVGEHNKKFTLAEYYKSYSTLTQPQKVKVALYWKGN